MVVSVSDKAAFIVRPHVGLTVGVGSRTLREKRGKRARVAVRSESARGKAVLVLSRHVFAVFVACLWCSRGMFLPCLWHVCGHGAR